jgi:ribonuclease P protein component
MKIPTLKKASQFQRVRLQGKVIKTSLFLLRWVRLCEQEHLFKKSFHWNIEQEKDDGTVIQGTLRIIWGFITSRKFGPAVERNRMRRRLKGALNHIAASQKKNNFDLKHSKIVYTEDFLENQKHCSCFDIHCVLFPRKFALEASFNELVDMLKEHLLRCFEACRL